MIYIDGDGPLQDFAKWMTDNEIPLGYDRGDTEAIFHSKVDSIFLDSPDAKYLFYFQKLYRTFHNVRILTAVGNHWPTLQMKEKASWNKKEALHRLGFRKEDIIVVDSGSDKIEFAVQYNEPNILYDDKWSTIEKWEAAGGLGFFVPECHIRFKELGHADGH